MPATGASLVIWAACCCVLASAGTALARRYSLRRRLIDEPGERRSHAVATPRGGGIAIVAMMLPAMAVLAVMSPSQRIVLCAAMLGLVLVAGVGWIDDHRPLPALARFAAHVAAAALFALSIYMTHGAALPAVIAFVLAIGLVNAWNFMDGIDGLAASQAAAAAAGYAWIADDPATRWMCVALASGCVGFLPFNFPRARIFLGDVGSGALGYLLAVVVMLVATPVPPAATAPPRAEVLLLLLPLSAFLVDAGLTLCRRILRGERWWMPHVQHAYQRWAAAVRSHRRVTLAYLGWSCVAIGVMVSTWRLDGPVIIAAVSGWYLGGGIVWVWLQSPRRRVEEEGSA